MRFLVVGTSVLLALLLWVLAAPELAMLALGAGGSSAVWMRILRKREQLWFRVGASAAQFRQRPGKP